ncbi:CDP-alcohol phosphatidyltransferase family protein [Actinomycetospora sp. TBRC 11914]|uniref:CDP-alcohol phosphatidyltransferase family protein n=1 Tax=Actinomycetospora sp. TBRC 11914 TaxID=2729387 RepID=UPI00145CB530|nr:CDP-alcohol phosphatidyltransferase family protein [Actinomycetospora sp. TBRC 11914]NMO90202.1 CDP-alcohol phosphatidyltransferase family protein [Actinomycetospora sp. TBRC 11914]
MAPEDTGDTGWSALHGGIRPSPLVRGWLRVVRALAAGPVARVPPDVLSASGVVVLVGAGALAVVGPPWTVGTALLVVLAGVLDGLDGAVALRTGRARPLGAVVDAVCDRLGDLVLAGVLVVLGAPVGWAVATAALTFLHEYARARAQAVGMPGVGAVTVAERPTRLIVVALAAAGSAAFPAGVPGPGWAWGTTFAVTGVALGIVGLGQLASGLGRSVPASFPPEPGPQTGPDR